MKKLFVAIIVLMITVVAKAQVESHVRWSYASKKTSATEAIVLIKATIDKDWHIYSQYGSNGGPLKTVFTFTPSKDYALVGKTIEPTPIIKYETAIGMNVGYFVNSVVFQQKIKLKLAGAAIIKGKLEFLACSKKCLPPEEVEFAIPLGKL